MTARGSPLPSERAQLVTVTEMSNYVNGFGFLGSGKKAFDPVSRKRQVKLSDTYGWRLVGV